MKKIRFIKEEDGILYMITNWKKVKNKIIFSSGKCWKYPIKKKRVA